MVTVTSHSSLALRLIFLLSMTVVGMDGGLLSINAAIAASDDPNRPNLLLVLVDDMGWAGTSVLMDPNNPDSRSDYHQTPNLEVLASQGMVFSNAYAAGPMCSPTRVSIQTGISPATMRVTDVRNASSTSHSRFVNFYNGYQLTPPQPRGTFPEATNLAESLLNVDSDYDTGWYGKWDWNPLPRYDDYEFSNDNDPRVNPPAEDPVGIYSLTQLATNFLDTSSTNDDPFFLIVSHDAPKGRNAKQSTIQEFESLPPGVKHHDSVYAAMHKDLDEGIGILLDKVNQIGVKDNTYVLFVSDHGAAIGLENQEIVNSPLYGGKGTIWEGGLRVPMIVAGPGIAPGTHSDVPTSTIDILPTFHELVSGSNAGMHEGVEGASLVPVLFNGGDLPAGQKNIERLHAESGELFFHYPHYGPSLPIGLPTPASAVRDGDFKLVRVYGESGAPDEYLLFDLTASLEESNDPNSPLNLASQLPAKVAELAGKLSGWLQDVDASLPYDVRSPVRLDWEANQSGTVANEWRSLQDVDFYDREVWSARSEPGPDIVPAVTHQPGVSNEAFTFDGSQQLSRRFVHVSDSRSPDTIDANHSASFEFWVRLDSLTGEHLLFEAGGESSGLSLTVGDANSDSSANDLRFRVLGRAGQHLTVTAPLDLFTNPVDDFVQVVGVVNDSETDRYIELYVNGALAGRVDGVAGNSEINWDSFARASIGLTTGSDTIGGNSGGGDLPFGNGGLRGAIASFRIENYAINPQQVLDSYNEKLDPVSLGVLTTSGAASKPTQRPSSVASGSLESNSQAVVIQERQDVLDEDLSVDLLADTDSQGLLAAGTEFASYLIHFDPIGNPATSTGVSGTVTFAGDILGILFENDSLSATDAMLGSIGEYALGERSGDFVNILADGRTLQFALTAGGDSVAQLRVLTTPILAGDYNGDNIVDARDYALWRESLGTQDLAADGNGDGDVDQSDFELWKLHFGSTAASNLASNFTPEPTSVLLLLTLSLCFTRRSPRKISFQAI